MQELTKIKQNEDFNFSIGSGLYKMQQRLTDYTRTKPINSIVELREGMFVIDKHINYHKVSKTYLSEELKNMNIGYYSINCKGNNINVWSARDNLRICI